MKRILSLLCAVALLLCGCVQNPEEQEAPAPTMPPASSSVARSVSEALPKGNPYENEPDAPAEEHTVEAITERGKLVVAVQTGHVPYSFLSNDGILCGYETALVQELGNALGVAAELLPVSEKALWDAVRSGAADLALGAWTEQAEEKETPVALCAQYDGEYGVLVRVEDKPKYNKPANFDGHAITHLKTDAGASALVEEDLWDVEPLEAEGVENAMRKLRSGSCDGALLPLPLARTCEQQNMDLGVSAVQFAEASREAERYVYVLRENTTLAKAMEKAVAEALKLGKIGEWMMNAESVLAATAAS